MIHRILRCFLAILVLLGASCLAQQAGTLKGVVLDPSGAIIPKSVIVLYWNPPNDKVSWNGIPKLSHKSPRKLGLSITTDENGQFSTTLFPGWWDVFVHADGFYPICQVVEVQTEKAQTVEFHFVRRVSGVIE